MQRARRFPLQSIPFVRLFVPFALGITFADHCLPPISSSIGCFIFSLLVQSLFSLLTIHQRFRFVWIGGGLVAGLMFSFGMLLQRTADVRSRGDFPATETSFTGQTIIASVLAPPEKKGRFFRCLAMIRATFDEHRFTTSTAKLNVYLSIEADQRIPAIGDWIVFSALPQRIRSTSNPGMFDFAAYASRQNLYYQVFLQSSSAYRIVPGKRKQTFDKWIEGVRQHTIRIIQKYISDKQSAGMGEALLIGYKSDLDAEISQAYSNTGLAHVVAISGLHLGLIYWLLSICLGFVNRKGMRWLYALLMLSGLWLFSVLAGAGPSIIRSAVMFTCFLIGKTFNRRNIVLNALAASAFLLLCYEPSWLWDVGFQLSYAAVLSLIIFMKPIYLSSSLHNKALDVLWQMCAVTLAAQILTLPLTIFYFHQVPLLFIFSNLVAVPLSTVVVFCLVAVCAFAWIDPVARLIGYITGLQIRWMNGFVGYMNDYPLSQISNIWITPFDTLLLFVVIIFASMFLNKPTLQKLRWLTVAVVATIVTFLFENILARYGNRIIVYNLPRAMMIDFVHNGKAFSIADSASLDLVTKYVEPTRHLWRTKAAACKVFENGAYELRFGSQRVIVIGRNGASPADVSGAVIILHNNPAFTFLPGWNSQHIMVVADGTNTRRKIEEWRRLADSLQIRFQAVSVDGPWIRSLKSFGD